MLGSASIIVFVPTTDFRKARAFYEGVLGLAFLKDDGFALVFKANETTVRVVRVQDFKAAPYTILGWHVEEIETTVAALEKKGVRCERYSSLKQDQHGIWTAPSGDRVAWFKDPDGNVLSITQGRVEEG